MYEKENKTMNIKKTSFISIIIIFLFFSITFETFCMDPEEEDKLKKEYEKTQSLLFDYKHKIQSHRRAIYRSHKELREFHTMFAGYPEESLAQIYMTLSIPFPKTSSIKIMLDERN